MKLPTYGLTPPKNYNSKRQVFDHTIFLKKEDVYIAPNSFNNKTIGPDNFLDLKREMGLTSILVTDRTKPTKNKLCIMNHVNRSGYNFLIGKTPTQGLPRFPDMSNIYNKIRITLAHSKTGAYQKMARTQSSIWGSKWKTINYTIFYL